MKNKQMPKCPNCKNNDYVAQHISNIFICANCGVFEDENFDIEKEEKEILKFKRKNL